MLLSVKYVNFVLFSILLTTSSVATAKSVPDYQIPVTQSQSTIDGVKDERFWNDALKIDFHYEIKPSENTKTSIKTVAYLSKNNEYFYLFIIATDNNPEEIRASLRDHDNLYQDDWIGIFLDTFNDERRSYKFYVNPLGSQMDAVYDDLSKISDTKWDATWQSVGKITDTGYQIEIAIPFKSIRYSNLQDEQIWGINFMRQYPRNETHYLASSIEDRGKNCKLCQYKKYTFKHNSSQKEKGIEITPTVSLSKNNSRDLGDPIWKNADINSEFSVDASWNITSENVLSATINPDFSQVEADALQLDVNTPFALFVPEKRTFFLEGLDYFQTTVPTVFTRNIVDPDVGIKITGKTNGNMYAAIYAEDTVTSFIIPGTHSSSVGVIDAAGESLVGRYRRDLGDTSALGFMLTSRQSGEYSNELISVDGRYSFNEQHSLTYQALHSETKYPEQIAIENEQSLDKFSGDGIYLSYAHQNRDWTNSVRYRKYSDGLRADMGFLAKVGYERLEFYNDRFLYGDDSNWWNKIRMHINWTVTHDNKGNLIRRGNETAIAIHGPLQSIVYFNYANVEQFWDGQLYDKSFFETYGEIKPNEKVIVQFASVIGHDIDLANNRPADGSEYAFWIQYNLNEHFTISTDFAISQLEAQNSRIFTAVINDLRMSYQFNLKHRLELTLQNQYVDQNQAMYLEPINKITKQFATRLIYSYKVTPRTVVYAGYSDNALANDEINSLFMTQKSGFLKFSYSFDM